MTTADVVARAASVAGQEMDWFFDAYLYHAAPPRLVLERDGTLVTLRWETPAEAPFTLPVEIRLDGSRQRVAMTDGRTTFRLPRPDAEIVLDPEGHILRARAADASR